MRDEMCQPCGECRRCQAKHRYARRSVLLTKAVALLESCLPYLDESARAGNLQPARLAVVVRKLIAKEEAT